MKKQNNFVVSDNHSDILHNNAQNYKYNTFSVASNHFNKIDWKTHLILVRMNLLLLAFEGQELLLNFLISFQSHEIF